MRITKHAKRRMKQRCGVGRKMSDSVAAKAFEEGIKHKNLSENLRSWVNGLYLRHKTANNVRLYNHKCYLFCDQNLVTVFDIPDNLIEEYEKLLPEKNPDREIYKVILDHPKSMGYTVSIIRNISFEETIIERYKLNERDKAIRCAMQWSKKEKDGKHIFDYVRIINDKKYEVGDDITHSTFVKM